MAEHVDDQPATPTSETEDIPVSNADDVTPVEGEPNNMDNIREEETDEEFLATDGESDDDEMKEVEKMIEAASQELQQVVEENEKMMEVLEGEEGIGEESFGEEAAPPAGGDGSFFKFDPTIDSAVLKELESAEKQAKETAKIISDLRTRVGELLKKEKMTETEAKELEEKNKLLKSQMVLFEEKIKRIQFLISQTNLFENMVPPKVPLQEKHKVDVLPKVIVCGYAENNMPKIIVCDDDKKKKKRRCTKKNEPLADSPRVSFFMFVITHLNCL